MTSFDEHCDQDLDPGPGAQSGVCEFAHECELLEEAELQPLGGADVEHCQRMRG